MTQYTGLYTQKLENGTIFNVQVTDSIGVTIPIEVDVYIRRGIRPPIDTLPDVSEYVSKK